MPLFADPKTPSVEQMAIVVQVPADRLTTRVAESA